MTDSPTGSVEPTCGYCGNLGWTVERYGRVTHKQNCPHRADVWHQGDPSPTGSGQRQGTHWDGCERAHHECALALIDRLRAEQDDERRTAGKWIVELQGQAKRLRADLAALREAGNALADAYDHALSLLPKGWMEGAETEALAAWRAVAGREQP